MNITNATIAGNTADQGAGVFALADADDLYLQMINSIVADSSGIATDFQTDTLNGGTITTGGNNNLVENNPTTDGFVAALTITGVDPQLAPLADNGGPTQTLGLLPGSPAINAGDSTVVTTPPFAGPPITDQRGLARIHAAVDLGAVESQITLSTPASPQSGTEGSATDAFALGSFASFDPDASSWDVSVSWGDSSPDDVFTVTSQGALGTRAHTFAEKGTYTITVTVSDDIGNTDRTSFTVTIVDAPHGRPPHASDRHRGRPDHQRDPVPVHRRQPQRHGDRLHRHRGVGRRHQQHLR